MRPTTLLVALAAVLCVACEGAPSPPPPARARAAAVVPVGDHTRVFVCAAGIARVVHSPSSAFPPDGASLVVNAQWGEVDFSVKSQGELVVITTDSMVVTGNVTSGAVAFGSTTTHATVLAESFSTFSPTTDLGRPTFTATQGWEMSSHDTLYGGGEYQDGLLNFNAVPQRMVQFNTEAVVPFFTSTQGYGVLVDNYATINLNPPPIQLNFTARQQGGALPDGTLLATAPCNTSDPAQQWQMNTTDSTLHLPNEASHTKVLDYDASTGKLHLWTRNSQYNGNQQWMVANNTIRNIRNSVCVSAGTVEEYSAVTATDCDTSSPPQLWNGDSIAQLGVLSLRSNPNLCLLATNEHTALFTPTTTGTYSFQIASNVLYRFGNAFVVKLSVQRPGGEELVAIDWDSLSNLPDALSGRVGLDQGVQYLVKLVWGGSDFPVVSVVPPDYGNFVVQAMGDWIDYYFMYNSHSPSIDSAIAGYRTATGAAPLYPRWVYGFWQCKEHYHNQQELLSAAYGFRNRSIPIDSIVQDWQYWGSLGWGPHWDPAIYPDPKGMVDQLHATNIHLMVSVWGKFDASTTFYKQMQSKGFLIPNSNYYDPYNASSRELYYSFSKANHFDIGVDALWLDATEPEGLVNAHQKLSIGSGNAYMNPYSLATTSAIADGLRRDFPNAQGARVFSLTRSSFAGQQRTGAALWSGDTSGAWDSLRRQVAASLNYQLSGIPYWSEDIGGFFRPGDQYTSPDYHELLVRWFQFGAFTPIYRVHGAGSNTEFWNYGDDVMERLNGTNNLRYRLLPYTYSLFWKADVEGYTVQRALPFDFPHDAHALSIADTFMYGPAFLVGAVVSQQDAMALSRTVYIPANAKANDAPPRARAAGSGAWFDFWTGATVPIAPGTTGNIAFSNTTFPLLVRAGSVVPMQGFMQHTMQLGTNGPLEIRVYPGADALFTLYDDDGVSAAYRDSAHHATVDLRWEDSEGALTIDTRQGSFEGMVAELELHVVFVGKGHGAGLDPEPAPDAVVKYSGQRVVVRRPAAAHTRLPETQ